jgi:hypothetical protein
MTFLLVALLGATLTAQPAVRLGRTSIPRSRAARLGPAATRTAASHRGRLLNGRCERVFTERPPGDEPDRVYRDIAATSVWCLPVRDGPMAVL